jgi:hypothetical protein
MNGFCRVLKYMGLMTALALISAVSSLLTGLCSLWEWCAFLSAGARLARGKSGPTGAAGAIYAVMTIMARLAG